MRQGANLKQNRLYSNNGVASSVGYDDAVSAPGLRERKKQQTRSTIADVAARLFAERGYEQVAVTDIALAAGVSQQTVYNYFPTKERLVLDREQEILDLVTEGIRARKPGTTPAAAVRDQALSLVDGIGTLSLGQARGGLGYQSAISPAVRRLCLEMTNRLADAITVAVLDSTNAMPSHLARMHAISLAWVFQTITDEAGRRQLAAQPLHQIATDLRPIVEDLLKSLDDWFRRR